MLFAILALIAIILLVSLINTHKALCNAEKEIVAHYENMELLIAEDTSKMLEQEEYIGTLRTHIALLTPNNKWYYERSFDQLMIDHLAFTLKTFPQGTAISALIHLRKEITETLQELTKEQNPTAKAGCTALAEEYADCLGCLLDSAARAGINPADLKRAFTDKLEINKARKWVKNPDNTYSHIKP